MFIVIVRARILAPGNGDPPALREIRLQYARLEHHRTDAVSETRRLHERIVRLVMGLFRIVGKKRIVGPSARHAGEVEAAAASRAERHRIVERTPLELVRGHDVPAPPATVVELRLVIHLHARDNHRAEHRVQVVGRAFPRFRNDGRIHKQPDDATHRRP